MNTENIKQPEGGLLQSSEWADLLRFEKKDVLALADEGDDGIHCIINTLPIVGMYTYVARACNINNKTINELLVKTKLCSASWMRIDVCSDELLSIVEANGLKYKKAPHDMQPKENFIIDISKSEDDLLSEMKSKTRYNVRLAQRKGVKIFTTLDKKHIKTFCDLVEKTANRKDVSFHNREHYEKIITKIPGDIIKLYVAEYEGEIIAANIISFYGGVATYLHGATSDNNRNVMAPFLLQWQAIKDAKERDFNWYDFGGVFPDSIDGGKQGITRFKMGFSPKTEIFKTLGSYDVVLKGFKYRIYRFLQKIKK
ncbi:MAG: lipid II:glycine glycyltransferase FemX [Candidatus Moraniibacteriota bacterium]|jgi:lipid II:glycine glycyltransferase (peptidoglycan interpeptide bridge formation enzyme)